MMSSERLGWYSCRQKDQRPTVCSSGFCLGRREYSRDFQVRLRSAATILVETSLQTFSASSIHGEMCHHGKNGLKEA